MSGIPPRNQCYRCALMGAWSNQPPELRVNGKSLGPKLPGLFSTVASMSGRARILAWPAPRASERLAEWSVE